MATKSLMKPETIFPFLFDDFFKPFNESFDGGRIWGRAATIPAANIVESKNDYRVSIAAPGLNKEDFKIEVDDNMLMISAEKEEKFEENEDRYTRQEYNYSSFSRSFSLPGDVQQEAIEAKYENGILKLVLPKKEEARKAVLTKHINVK